MTEYLHGYNVVIDPEQGEQLPDGRWHQEVTLVLVDEPNGADTRRPVAVTLAPDDARELAFCLLAAAEHAQRTAAPAQEDER